MTQLPKEKFTPVGNFYHLSSSDLKAKLWVLNALPDFAATIKYRNLLQSIIDTRRK